MSGLPSDAAQVDACIDAALAGKRRGRKLNCGEQGCAYMLDGAASHVIKVSEFKTEDAAPKWRAEACLGTDLGMLGVGPKIYRMFECRSRGYIVMDFLHVANKLLDGTRIREKIITKPANEATKEEEEFRVIDHIALMPSETQGGFVDVLARMVSAGYIHMDNHLDNLGYIGGSPIAFDFGFTQSRAWGGKRDRLFALAFSLFNMLEHCPLEELFGTHIWRVASAILANADVLDWDAEALMSDAAPMTAAQLSRAYPLPATKTAANALLRAFKKRAAEMANAPANVDVYVGSMCYAMILQIGLPERYDVEPFYTTIYRIRRGEAY